MHCLDMNTKFSKSSKQDFKRKDSKTDQLPFKQPVGAQQSCHGNRWCNSLVKQNVKSSLSEMEIKFPGHGMLKEECDLSL